MVCPASASLVLPSRAAGAAHYALLEMARRTVGPRRTDSQRTYVRGTRIIAGLSVLVLSGAIVWDLVNDGFWSRHALFTSLVASLIIVAMTAAGLNELLQRRQRERWSVLAQYAERREQLHRLIAGLLGHGQELLGRWAEVMVSSGTYAEIVDRHVELYSRLYWWGSVLDESEPLQEHLSRPRLSRVSPAIQATIGPVEDEWLRDNLVAIAQLAESLDRGSFELAMRIVPIEWWVTQLPDRPPTAERLGS
jgi:hypothetical protein